MQLHRRLLYDDNKGVVEPLDETAFGEGLVVRGTHTVQLNSLNMAADAHRLKTVETVYAPVSMVAKSTFQLNDWISRFNKNVS